MTRLRNGSIVPYLVSHFSYRQYVYIRRQPMSHGAGRAIATDCTGFPGPTPTCCWLGSDTTRFRYVLAIKIIDTIVVRHSATPPKQALVAWSSPSSLHVMPDLHMLTGCPATRLRAELSEDMDMFRITT